MAKKVTTTEKPEVSSVLDRIAPVADLEMPMTAMFYGRSGTGKTTLAATFPKPALILDIREKGTESIANVPGIDRIAVESWDDVEELYWHLESGKSKYKTVIIDQVSGLQDLAMAKAKKDDNLEDSDLVPRRIWGHVSGMLKTWLFSYRDLIEKGICIVFIAHERTNEGEEGVEDQIEPSIGPRLMPSVASAINGAVSYIGSTFIREKFVGEGKKEDKTRIVEYCLRIGPHAFYTTKMRRPKDSEEAPDVLVNPTYDKIFALSKGESISKRKVKTSK